MTGNTLERSVCLHLSQDLFKGFIRPLSWMCMHPIIGGHHNPFVFSIALDLLLDIAPIMSTFVVTSAQENKGSKVNCHEMMMLGSVWILNFISFNKQKMYVKWLSILIICIGQSIFSRNDHYEIVRKVQ